jgi:hypothetical protein
MKGLYCSHVIAFGDAIGWRPTLPKRGAYKRFRLLNGFQTPVLPADGVYYDAVFRLAYFRLREIPEHKRPIWSDHQIRELLDATVGEHPGWIPTAKQLSVDILAHRLADFISTRVGPIGLADCRRVVGIMEAMGAAPRVAATDAVCH